MPFARYWMHNGLMKTGSEKMSKSKGNEIVVSELLKRHHPETLRFFLLATHYRRPIDYSEERLEEIRRGLDNFYRFFERFRAHHRQEFLRAEAAQRHAGEMEPGLPSTDFLVEVVRHWRGFLGHMDDDFNTGGAIGVLYELLNALNRFADVRQLEPGKGARDLKVFERGSLVLKELSDILGVFVKPVPVAAAAQDRLVGGLMQLLLDLRADFGTYEVRYQLGQVFLHVEDDCRTDRGDHRPLRFMLEHSCIRPAHQLNTESAFPHLGKSEVFQRGYPLTGRTALHRRGEEGSRHAMVFWSPARYSFTRLMPLLWSMAWCGHALMQFPQRIHRSGITLILFSSSLIALTGQCWMQYRHLRHFPALISIL